MHRAVFPSFRTGLLGPGRQSLGETKNIRWFSYYTIYAILHTSGLYNVSTNDRNSIIHSTQLHTGHTAVIGAYWLRQPGRTAVIGSFIRPHKRRRLICIFKFIYYSHKRFGTKLRRKAIVFSTNGLWNEKVCPCNFDLEYVQT